MRNRGGCCCPDCGSEGVICEHEDCRYWLPMSGCEGCTLAVCRSAADTGNAEEDPRQKLIDFGEL